MDIDKLEPDAVMAVALACFSSLMDIDKLELILLLIVL